MGEDQDLPQRPKGLHVIAEETAEDSWRHDPTCKRRDLKVRWVGVTYHKTASGAWLAAELS